MAQHIHLKKDIDSVMFRGLMLMMDNNFEKENIRRTNQMGGAPDFEVNDDIIFYNVINMELPYEKVINEFWNSDETELIQIYNNELRVHITCYGPNAYDITQDIKSRLFFPDVKDFFENYYIYISGYPTEPVLLSDLQKGQWFNRYDMDLRFKHQIERKRKWDYFDVIGIEIKPEHLESRHIYFKEEE